MTLLELHMIVSIARQEQFEVAKMKGKSLSLPKGNKTIKKVRK